MSTPMQPTPSVLGNPQPEPIESEDGSNESLVLSQKRLRSVAASDRETLLRGRRAFESGNDAVALESLGRLAEMGHQYADVYYMIGMLQERRGELDLAINSLRQATRINPRYIEALLALASLHERRGDYDISRGYAERASDGAGPSTGSGLDATTLGKLANQQAALADALAEAGETREAIEEYRHALDRCPMFHDIRHRLGLALREAGLPFQAAQEFQRILELHPKMFDSQIQLGLTYYSLGRTPDAIEEWRKVIESDPSRDDARMYLRLVGGSDGAADLAPPTATADDTAQSEGWTKRSMSSTPLLSINEVLGAAFDANDPADGLDLDLDEEPDLRAALDTDSNDDLLDLIEDEALERLEGQPMPSADDLFKD